MLRSSRIIMDFRLRSQALLQIHFVFHTLSHTLSNHTLSAIFSTKVARQSLEDKVDVEEQGLYNCAMKSPVQKCLAAAPGRSCCFDGRLQFLQGLDSTLASKNWRRSRIPSLPGRGRRALPELTRGQLGSAVHLVEPDGSVYFGAEAALRALAKNPHEQWLLDWYEQSPFSRASASERTVSSRAIAVFFLS